jgi:hypothetical protein
VNDKDFAEMSLRLNDAEMDVEYYRELARNFAIIILRDIGYKEPTEEHIQSFMRRAGGREDLY